MQGIVVALLLGAVALQLLFWGGVATRITRERSRCHSLSKKPPFLSVIICARNELENLRRHLPSVLSQDYPCFEVLVVDDGSTDGSGEYLENLACSTEHLRVVSLQGPRVPGRGKKPALEAGILKAQGQLLLLTDADCHPASRFWMQRMVGCAVTSTDLILGYSPYLRGPGLLNRFIRLETLYTAIQYLGFALSGMTYMGVGRNIMYRKPLWEGVGGFSGHASVTGGDDDLFVSSVGSQGRFAVCLHPDAFVWTIPSKSLREYLQQKRRHVSTSLHYPLKTSLMLGLLASSNAAIYPLLIWAALSPGHLTGVGIWAVAIRMTVMTVQYKRIGSLLEAGRLWIWAPLFDIFLPWYQLALVPGLFRSRGLQWRDRTEM